MTSNTFTSVQSFNQFLEELALHFGASITKQRGVHCSSYGKAFDLIYDHLPREHHHLLHWGLQRCRIYAPSLHFERGAAELSGCLTLCELEACLRYVFHYLGGREKSLRY